MVTVYAIKNSINKEIYVGMTKSVSRRLAEHNTGKNRYTKAFIPWTVFYTEEHPDYQSGRIREKQLKSASGKRFLRKQEGNEINPPITPSL